NSKRQAPKGEYALGVGRSDSGSGVSARASGSRRRACSTRVETLSRDDPPANRARPTRNWRQMLDNKLKTPFIALFGAVALMVSAPAFAQAPAPAAPAADAAAAPAAAPAADAAPAAPATPNADEPPQMKHGGTMG